MNLSGQQRKNLLAALNDAFRDKALLEQMLAFELDKNLDTIAGGNNLQEIVFNLIKIVEAQGWVEDLVFAARRSNPGNLKLKAIAEELFPIQSPEPHKVPSPNILSKQSTETQKILILAALPDRLRLDKEIREIEEAIKRAVKRDSFEIKIRTAVRPQDIRRAIAEEKPQIVHFCGHGQEDGSLVLEDDGGNQKPVLPTGLAALFKLHTEYVKCVLLNVCYSALPAEAISKHINYVIGMNQPIEDRAAIIFAQGFYDGLGYDNVNNLDVITRAFNEGIVAIQLENLLQDTIPHLWKLGIATGEIEPIRKLDLFILCPHCKFKNPDAYNFCQKCGTSLSDLDYHWRQAKLKKQEQRKSSTPISNSDDDLRSDRAIDYTRLRDLLKAGNGTEAARKEESERPSALSRKVVNSDLAIQDKYYEWLIGKYQKYETEGLSLLGSVCLADVFVPLKVATNYETNARSEIIPLRDYNINLPKTIWDFLIAATGDKPTLNQSSIVILGAPGSGKTTLLKHLAYVYARKEEKKHFEKAPQLIPVLLLIREVYQEIVEKQPPLIDFIAEHVKFETEHQLLSKWFTKKINENKCLIMLDGLDEVADETQRSVVKNWIDKQINSFRKNVFILTSRPRGYKEASLKNAGIILEVQPFKIEQVRDFIHKWYLATEKIRLVGDSISTIEEQAKEQAEDLINRIRNSSPLAAMAVNPLLLTMISIVHHQLSLKKSKLPERRVDLYKEMCEVLLEKRQQEKNISDKLTGKNKQSVLQVLAMELMQQTNSEQQTATEFKMSQGISWIQEPLALEVSNEVQPKQFLKYICDVSGLLVEKELNYYQFAHLSFQEYLAATQIRELNQENLLITNITKSWWAETIRLYAAQSDATKLIRAVLDMQSPSVDVMALAYDCLEECLRVDGKVQRELIQRLEDGLESTDSEVFKLAAQVRLIRRLRNFVRINEESEIDYIYITCAEYQLFLGRSKRFLPGDAKNTITGISWENALRFCAWLGQWYRTRLGNQLSEMAVHYRLPEKEEINQYSINDDTQFSESGIRLVKFQLPSRYSKLADYLWSREWRKADEETANLMLQVSKSENKGYLNVEDIGNFPCDDLRQINFLWVYASKRHFGFSVQKNIYQSLSGTSRYSVQEFSNFRDRVGWRVNQKDWIEYSKVTFDTTAAAGHLPVAIWACGFNEARLALLSSLASRLVDCNL